MSEQVAVVHDYLTQRGGAERVVLSMLKAFPGAPVVTSLYEPGATYPEFGAETIAVSPLNQFHGFRRNHRLALPLLAPVFASMTVSADVVLCSSSGWAHGIHARGRKVVYCHNPARWLYQTEAYLGQARGIKRTLFATARPSLMAWDLKAARSADAYFANSSVVRERIRRAYGIDAEVIPPPPTLQPNGPQRPVAQVAPGFLLAVARLLAHKNVKAIVESFRHLPDERLLVVGEGPERQQLEVEASTNVTFLGAVHDDALRWLYAKCDGLVAAAKEDYGLTPLEAATFGKPSVLLRRAGFLDTMVEGKTAVFFSRPEPSCIRAAIRDLRRSQWEVECIQTHAASYSEERFISRLRDAVFRASGAS